MYRNYGNFEAVLKAYAADVKGAHIDFVDIHGEGGRRIGTYETATGKIINRAMFPGGSMDDEVLDELVR